MFHTSQKTYVFVTTTFIAYHQWKGAPDEVSFLRDLHRHVFHVRLTVPVKHSDRDVEFIMLKRELDSMIRLTYHERNIGQTSCEMIAEQILDSFGRYEPSMCSVSEDDENGAMVSRTYN